MTNIEFTIKDQAILAFHTPILASGGKNDIKVTFNFTYSEEWKGYAKTGVFYMDKNDIRFAKLDSQNSCFVPWETYRKDGILHIGVFGVKGDSKKTSALYEYTIREGAISDNGKPSDPTPEIYEQILSEFAKMETDFNNRINSVETRVDNLISAQPVDAELKDVRVGFDNTTYKSAGEAVRSQVNDLNLKTGALDNRNPLVSIRAKSVQKNKALNNKGQVIDLQKYICSELMEFKYPKGYFIKASAAMTDTVAGVCFYDKNQSLIIAYDKKTAEAKGITVKTTVLWAYYFEVPVNTKYIRLCRLSGEPLIKDNIYFEMQMPNFALGHSLHIKGNNIDEYFDGSQNKELDLAKIQGSSKYEDLPDKPSVNGVPLVGNKTSKDLKINVETDKTLSVEGMAADAKTTGDEIEFVKQYAIKKEISGEKTYTRGIYAAESNKPETIIAFGENTKLYSMTIAFKQPTEFDWRIVQSDNAFAPESNVTTIGEIHHVTDGLSAFVVNKEIKANQGIAISNYTANYLRVGNESYPLTIAYLESDNITQMYKGEINLSVKYFEEHPYTLELDETLKTQGAAADSSAVGKAITRIEDNTIIYGITEEKIYKRGSQPETKPFFVKFTNELKLYSIQIPFKSPTSFDWKIIESDNSFAVGSLVKDVTPVHHVDSSENFFIVKRVLKTNQAILVFNYTGTLVKIGGDIYREYCGILNPNNNSVLSYYKGELNCTIRLFDYFPENTNPLKGKKLYIFGDSMSVEMNEPENWASLIAQHNGMELHNYGIMATTIVQGKQGVPGSIYNRICNTEDSKYYVTDVENADYIAVYGGTNDIGRSATIGDNESSDPETFYGALNAICTTLQNRNPKAKIMFITPYVKYNDSHSPEFPDKCRQYINIIKEVCAKYFIPVFDNSTYGGINYFNPGMVTALFQKDELHLNYEGQKYVTPKYEAFMKTL